MEEQELLEGNKLLFKYLKDNNIIEFGFGLSFDNFEDEGLCSFETSWDMMFHIIDYINGLGKEYHFAIFKTYVSLSVEKSSKYFKDFSFAHAEYITSEQTGKEAAFRLLVKFIKWQDEKKLENNQ
jgi:hypothetical protein